MTSAVAAAWEALSRGASDEALALLDGADDDPEALEALGVAHWWRDDADATIDVRERAYRIYRERGDHLGARCATHPTRVAERETSCGSAKPFARSASTTRPRTCRARAALGVA